LTVKRVLAVEDSPTVREVIRRVLGPIGFEVIEADSYEGAMAAMTEGVPDLVIADCSVPGVDWKMFLGAVRGGETTVPVLMLSAGGTGALAATALKSGAADVLYRPFIPDRLVSKAVQLLARASASA